ncbi:MAG TPA: hypothetical protein DDZ76_14575 [Xanthomonadales bacterium]|nr:hypothetical protein [Xanthomonadales bacterium]
MGEQERIDDAENLAKLLGHLRPERLRVLADRGGALSTAIAMASRRPLDWVAGLAMDDAIRLATVRFEVNADFFVLRVVPTIHRYGFLQTSFPGRLARLGPHFAIPPRRFSLRPRAPTRG